MTRLSHLDRNGRARMVDVSAKAPTRRRARVQAVVHLSEAAFEAVQRGGMDKGDPITVARLAGIQAAKRTDELIPLCHPLPLEHVAVACEPDAATRTIRIVVETVTTAKTGIEVEAFVATAIASVALYDMVKAVDPLATITDLQLLEKTGGRHPITRSRG
jgi:cyclic pyranopterin phosphate synthase